ncbi:MAG: tripartite tricarboxylate transporter substrate binding protein, partial [Planctomycetes bacterium]|nr:tripartite tricarboxylate transporter substrate binding protein [Planctomycetota bacterium]
MFQKNKITRRHLLGLALASGVGLTMASTSAFSADIDSIHFLIPGGAGGGWDGTARGTGEALSKSGIIKSASYENMSGGGGGKAIGYLIENAASNHGTLMVNSTPIVIRSLVGRFPHNFRDLTMIAGTIGDYGAIITGKDSPYKDFKDLV